MELHWTKCRHLFSYSPNINTVGALANIWHNMVTHSCIFNSFWIKMKLSDSESFGLLSCRHCACKDTFQRFAPVCRSLSTPTHGHIPWEQPIKSASWLTQHWLLGKQISNLLDFSLIWEKCIISQQQKYLHTIPDNYAQFEVKSIKAVGLVVKCGMKEACRRTTCLLCRHKSVSV